MVKIVYLPSPCSLEATWHPRLQPGTGEPLGCCVGCVLAPISVLRVEIPHPLRDKKKLKQTTSHKTRAVLPAALPSVFSYVLRCLLKPVCVCIHACPPVVVVLLWCWLSLSLSLSHAHFFQFCFSGDSRVQHFVCPLSVLYVNVLECILMCSIHVEIQPYP